MHEMTFQKATEGKRGKHPHTLK